MFTPWVKYSCLSTFPTPFVYAFFLFICFRLLSQTCNEKNASMRKNVYMESWGAICSFVLLANIFMLLNRKQNRAGRERFKHIWSGKSTKNALWIVNLVWREIVSFKALAENSSEEWKHKLQICVKVNQCRILKF